MHIAKCQWRSTFHFAGPLCSLCEAGRTGSGCGQCPAQVLSILAVAFIVVGYCGVIGFTSYRVCGACAVPCLPLPSFVAPRACHVPMFFDGCLVCALNSAPPLRPPSTGGCSSPPPLGRRVGQQKQVAKYHPPMHTTTNTERP